MSKIVSDEQIMFAKILAIEEYLIGADDGVRRKLKQLEDKNIDEVLKKSLWGEA